MPVPEENSMFVEQAEKPVPEENSIFVEQAREACY